MKRLLIIHAVIATVLCAALASARAEALEPNVAAFDLDGLTLSIAIDDFRRIYPGAELNEKTAARYCYGKKVRIDSLTRLGAVVRRDDVTIHVTFDQRVFGQGISTIKRDEGIEFDPSRFISLRDGLVRRYGPYTGLMVPDKMDPAGLIVGFEWVQRNVAYMSVTLHQDHTSDSGPIRQTTFLTRSLPGMEDHVVAAAYYRDAIRNFRENCARNSSHDVRLLDRPALGDAGVE